MRTAFTILFVLLFIGAVSVLTFIDGAVRLAADPDQVVAVTEKAGVRTALLDAAEQAIVGQVAEDPRLGGVSRTQIRGILEAVASKPWFEATLRRCHRPLLVAVAAAPETSMIDLRGLKTELEAALGELVGRAEKACIELAGEAQCTADSPARRDVDAEVANVQNIVRHIDDQVDLVLLVTHDREHEETFRRWLARAPQMRTAGIVILAGLFGLIFLLNIVPLRRLLAATGLALLLAAGVALGLHAAAADRARVELDRRLSQVRPRERQELAAVAIMQPIVARLTTATVEGAAANARPPLVLGAIVGVMLTAAALAAGRRRRA